MKKVLNYLLLLLVVGLVSGCTEQYVMQTESFEDAIVVEATITNALQKQQVKVTRTYVLESNTPIAESNAEVVITDDLGNRYDFTEDTPGVYLSATEFAAMPGRLYRLNITTSSGKSYASSAEILSTVNEIQDVVPTVEIRDGIRGVELNVKSYDPTNSSKYYRYEYVETYKIIAPNWSPSKTIITGDVSNPVVEVVPRVGETRICYSTDHSTDILLTTTSGQSEDRVNYPIRFISNKNYIISHRYSILVTQYVQSLAAYSYYKTLRDISGSGTVLSPNQPGFLYGNIKSLDNPNEKVIGFFEVASVSSKRIFFNYTDLFPNENLPPYYTTCKVKKYTLCFDYDIDECSGWELISGIASNSIVYVNGFNADFYMVAPPCGDCTTFSSNIIPSFWID